MPSKNGRSTGSGPGSASSAFEKEDDVAHQEGSQASRGTTVGGAAEAPGPAGLPRKDHDADSAGRRRRSFGLFVPYGGHGHRRHGAGKGVSLRVRRGASPLQRRRS